MDLKERLARTEIKTFVGMQQAEQIIDSINMAIDRLPENLPLYKDSGTWQMLSDDMDVVLCEQNHNESFFDFIERCARENGHDSFKI